MRFPRNILAIAFMLLAIAGAAFLVIQATSDGGKDPEFATVWPQARALAEFELTDHTGQPFTQESLRDNSSVIFFGFTHCPDICPATLQKLSMAQKKIMQSGVEPPRIILISVDPERDSPDVLATYIDHFNADITGVSGSLSELTKLTSSAGVFFQKSIRDDGSYSVDHSSVVLVIDKDAAIRASFSAPHSIDNFVRDLPIVLGNL